MIQDPSLTDQETSKNQTRTDSESSSDRPKDVALFVTCLVDLFRPNVGFAAVKLLEEAGCRISVPNSQTCCGQPAYNSGDNGNAEAIARNVIEIFEGHEFIVAPSGSCAGMIKKHYPSLFPAGSDWRQRAEALASKTFELVSFLVDVLKVEQVGATFNGTVTYHDSCSGLRELKIVEQPRKLLSSVQGLTIKPMKDSDVCCGFGGTFCVKYPDVSNAMVSRKTENIAESGADTLLAGDLGCLMNMAGRLSREGREIHVRHVAEVLADMVDQPAIGEGKGS